MSSSASVCLHEENFKLCISLKKAKRGLYGKHSNIWYQTAWDL